LVAHKSEEPETDEQTKDTRIITLPKTRIHTLEQLLDYCEVDTEQWEVERFIVNKWEVGAKDANKQIKVEPLYQVKAWLKKRHAIIAIRSEIEDLKAEAKKYAPRFSAIVRPKLGRDNMLEIGPYDHHMGKLAWSKETGWEDYDVPIAERTFDSSIDALIARTNGHKYEYINFIVGHDLQHTNNRENQTVHGTVVTADSRFQKVFGITRRMIVRNTDKLRSVAPVRIRIVPGNHDEDATWFLGDSLECWYHKAKDVVVDNAPVLRKYDEFGKVMLMWTHGCYCKLDKYPGIMAAERPEIFGRTRFREAHTGDKHQRRLEEYNGVVVRIMPSLCAADDWHAQRGFIANIRTSEAYVWNREQGLIGTAHYNVPDQGPRGYDSNAA
jgi:hypothetical protein